MIANTIETEYHQMSDDVMYQLKDLCLAPYIQKSYRLINKPRKNQSNMFRHQGATLYVLFDYGYCDSILLKASIIHDLIEDCEDYNENEILYLDEGYEVLRLVHEVSRTKDETKKEFLSRILVNGSFNAKVLKCADRISNLIDCGFCSDIKLIQKTIRDTVDYIIPMAEEVNPFMVMELNDLVKTRKEILKKLEFIERITYVNNI